VCCDRGLSERVNCPKRSPERCSKLSLFRVSEFRTFRVLRLAVLVYGDAGASIALLPARMVHCTRCRISGRLCSTPSSDHTLAHNHATTLTQAPRHVLAAPHCATRAYCAIPCTDTPNCTTTHQTTHRPTTTPNHAPTHNTRTNPPAQNNTPPHPTSSSVSHFACPHAATNGHVSLGPRRVLAAKAARMKCIAVPEHGKSIDSLSQQSSRKLLSVVLAVVLTQTTLGSPHTSFSG
jgi:hypothetical protein